MATFMEALRIQFRVILALVLREIGSRHGGDSTGILWLMLEPIIITLLVIGIHFVGTTGDEFLHSVPIVVFLLTGYTPHLMFRHAGLAGASAWTANRGLLYHRQVHAVDLVLARLAVEIFAVLIAFIVTYVIFYYFGEVELPEYIPYIFLGWFYHIWFIVIMCFFFTGGCLVFPLLRRMFQPIALIALPAYCAFFMLSWLPSNTQWWLLWFPSANATEMMRYGFLGDSASTFFNISYTTEACTLLTFFGIVVMLYGRRYLEL